MTILLVLVLTFALMFVLAAHAHRAYSNSLRLPFHPTYRPYGGAREIARRKRQLERGIIRTN